MTRSPHVLIGALALAIVFVGCAPEPEAATSTTSTPPAPTSPTATSAVTSTPSPTAAEVPLPASCDELYPSELLATLNDEAPPLNDPGLGDLLSTEMVAGLDILGSGVPRLRCTWGAPGSPGLATTVARIDGGSATTLTDDLTSSGFACEALAGGTVCRVSQQTIDQNDQVRTNGETHWFGGGWWVATHWVDYDPDGYTEALAARLAN